MICQILPNLCAGSKQKTYGNSNFKMKIRACAHFFVSALLAVLLVSCSSMPPEQESRAQFIHQQKSSARSLQEQGRLAESRTLWLTLLTLDASDSEAVAAVSRLDRSVDKSVADSWRRGESSYKGGNRREGDIWMLKVLAVQPGNKGALEQLRKSESNLAQAQQRDKSGKESRKILALQRAEPGGVNERIQGLYVRGAYEQVLEAGTQIVGQPDPNIATVFRKSHLALAEQAQASGDLELALTHIQGAIASNPQTDEPLLSRADKLRGQLSNTFYKEGLSLVHEDLTGAIEALEKSVFYNPNNNAAKRKLLQARKLQNNLKRIQGSDA